MYVNQTVAVALLLIGLTFAVAARAAAQPETPAQEEKEPVRAVEQYNLPKKSTLAIKGYDPVAYFPEGGKEPARGLASIEHTHKGVTYRFATRENLERFRTNPDRYEPAYGGWCAWAMVDRKKAPIDPRKFVVKEGRLFLYFNGLLNDTRAKWLRRDHARQAKQADDAWKKQTGEAPRKPKNEDAEEEDDPA